MAILGENTQPADPKRCSHSINDGYAGHQPDNAADASALRALLVEDDPTSRMLAESVLTKISSYCILSNDGKQAFSSPWKLCLTS